MFRLLRDDISVDPAVVFEDSTSPGLSALWDAAGVYDALYNSDGRAARDISRTIAYGIDRLNTSASFARLVPPTTSLAEALRFLENVHRGCIVHSMARIETQ
jgi:hypothetical protein